TAETTSFESGVTADSKRCTTLPLRSTRNFVKFHLMSPAMAAPVCLVRYWESGVWSSPLTDTFLYMGNVTLYFREQKVLISSFVPGSWAPKLLAGKPTMTKPWSLYLSYKDSSALYCGV